MKQEVKTKFGTYTMETETSTKISTDKLGVFVERLKKIGIERYRSITANGWVYEKVFYLEISKFILTFVKKLSHTPCYVYVKLNYKILNYGK